MLLRPCGKVIFSLFSSEYLGRMMRPIRVIERSAADSYEIRPAFDNYSRRMLRLSNEANCHRRDICFLANLFGIGDLKAKTAW